MFYGWKIVGVAFLTHFISIGFVFYSFGTFFKSLADEFGGSRLGVGLSLAILNVATACLAPFVGRRLDRSIRDVMTLGTVLLALGFFLASRVQALWQFYAILGTLLGAGGSMLGAVAGATLVTNWFHERRGAALGIATMGISLSGMVMAPVSARLVETIGWRGAFATYGVVTIVLVLPAVRWFVVDRPEDMGLLPDGRALPEPPRRPGDAEEEETAPMIPMAAGDQMIDHAPDFRLSAMGAMRRREFWVIVGTMSLNMCCNGAILTHIVPHATDMGYAPRSAAFVLSVMAGLGVIGKVFFGWVTDRVDQRLAVLLSSGLQATGVLLLIRADHYGALLGAGAVFGFGMGGLVPLWGTLVAAVFERKSFGRVMGLMSPCMVPIHSTGVPFAGRMYDRFGSYDFAFGTFVGLYLLAMCLILALRLPKTGRPSGAGR